MFPADVGIVRLDASVTDRDGQPVRDLSPADFEVIEKGERRPVVSLERIDVPRERTAAPVSPAAVGAPRLAEPARSRCFVLLVDAPITRPLRGDFERFFDRDLLEGDWVTVIAPRADVWWTARTPWEHRLLPELLGRIRTPGSHSGQAAWEAMRAVEYGSATGADSASRGETQSLPRGEPSTSGRAALGGEEMYAVAVREIRITLAALKSAIAAIADFRGRKTVFLVSTGFIRAPRMRELFDEVIAAARRAGGHDPLRQRRRVSLRCRHHDRPALARDGRRGGGRHRARDRRPALRDQRSRRADHADPD